jgi:hypothetical protein
VSLSDKPDGAESISHSLLSVLIMRDVKTTHELYARLRELGLGWSSLRRTDVRGEPRVRV